MIENSSTRLDRYADAYTSDSMEEASALANKVGILAKQMLGGLGTVLWS